MGRELSHEEVTDLLGAYALDALEPAEHQAVDRHVEGCPACRREVAEHREVAGLLTPGWGAPPAGVWERIAASLDEAPPPLDMAPVIAMKRREAPITSAPPRSRRGVPAAIAAMVAVAAVAVIGVLGVRLIADKGPGTYDEELKELVQAALDDPSSRKVQLASTGRGPKANVVILPDGTGYLVDDDNLPTLPSERTYQMWAVVGNAKISIGVLGREPKIVPFKMDGNVSALAITEEVAGGVVSSKQNAVVQGSLQTA